MASEGMEQAGFQDQEEVSSTWYQQLIRDFKIFFDAYIVIFTHVYDIHIPIHKWEGLVIYLFILPKRNHILDSLNLVFMFNNSL